MKDLETCFLDMVSQDRTGEAINMLTTLLMTVSVVGGVSQDNLEEFLADVIDQVYSSIDPEGHSLH